MGQLPSPEWTANKLRSDGSDGIGGAYLCSVFFARRLFDFRCGDTSPPATPPHHDTALSCHCLVVIRCLHSCRLSGTDVNPTFATDFYHRNRVSPLRSISLENEEMQMPKVFAGFALRTSHFQAIAMYEHIVGK